MKWFWEDGKAGVDKIREKEQERFDLRRVRWTGGREGWRIKRLDRKQQLRSEVKRDTLANAGRPETSTCRAPLDGTRDGMEKREKAGANKRGVWDW